MKESFSISKCAAVLIAFLSVSAPLALAQGAPTTWELVVCASKDDLPFSNEKQQGFENHIMSLLAQDVHAELTYVWLPSMQVASQNLLLLKEGKCDVFLDVGDGPADFLTTLAYYQTTYYFVYRADASFQISGLDDAALKTFRIGVVMTSPPDVALSVRGLTSSLHHYVPDPNSPAPQMMDDVVNKTIDVAVIFGPLAGPLAEERPGLKLVPVSPQVDLSGLSMVYQTTMGLREGDTDLRDLLNQALAHTWDDIQEILEQFNIPILPLPKPIVSIGG